MNDQHQMHEICEQFQAGTIRACLHCVGDYCTLDVGVEQDPRRPCESAVVEVLLQPRTRVGMPFGRPASVLRHPVRLNSLPGDRYAWGRVMLPLALQPRVARSCYYRISPRIIGTEPTMIGPPGPGTV